MSTTESTINISKETLFDIQTCLQHTQEKIDFLQIESQLQQDELQQYKHHDTNQQKINNVDLVPNEATVVHADAEIQPALPKSVIRPWEEHVHNKHITGLGYGNDVSFNILDQSKPIHFQSARFRHDSSPSAIPNSTPLPQQQEQQIVKCEHCD